MNPSPCDPLDNYLDRALPDEAHAAFADHARQCPTCRQAVEDQGRVDDLLRRAVAREPVPEGLTPRIARRLREAERGRRLRRAAGLAAALLAGLGLWGLGRQPPPETPRPPEQAETAPPAPDPRSLVDVTFESSPSVIALPLRTDSPNVTVIWIYPTADVDAPDPTLVERNGP